jgi:hypothetical protein
MDGIDVEQKGCCTALHGSFGVEDMDLPEGLHTLGMLVQQTAKISCRLMGCGDG